MNVCRLHECKEEDLKLRFREDFYYYSSKLCPNLIKIVPLPPNKPQTSTIYYKTFSTLTLDFLSGFLENSTFAEKEKKGC